MSDRLLPTYISPATAAVLCGRSVHAIRGMVTAGLLPAEGRRWKKIKLCDLEAVTGRQITVADFMEADRRRDRNRAAMRRYNEARVGSP